MQISICPDLSQLQKLVSGHLPAADVETLVQHLETCPDCMARVPALSAQPDTLVELLKQAKTPPVGWQDPVVGRLIARIAEMRRGPAASPKMLVFPCPACGKNMKAGADLAGKKVKCPACAQVATVPVPAAESPPGVGEKTLPPRELAAPKSNSVIQGLVLTDPTQMPLGQDKETFAFLAPPQQPDELGRLGNYRVLKKLGAGGMGVVFLAEDLVLHRKVALKTMLPAFAADAQNRERFLREARAAASIEHDHIVAIHQVGEDNGVPYLAMPLLKGEPLDARLAREGKLPVAESLRIAAEMAEGLAAAHAAGLIHRDVKPGNVWLEAVASGQWPVASEDTNAAGPLATDHWPLTTARVKLLDFGLARSQRDDARLTQSGAVLGTPAYMPPEQAQGEPVDARADLFSLGCVLYEMLTGERPFRGDNTIALLAALALQDPTPPRVKNPSVPIGVNDLTMRLLAKKPADRPASAREVARQLRWLLQFANKEQTRPDKTTPAKVNPLPGIAAKAAIAMGKFAGKAITHGGAAGLHAAKALIRRPRLAAAVAAACFLVFAWFYAGAIWRIATNRGELVIETDDPNLVVTVKGETVTLYDKVKDRRFVLTAGDYAVEVREESDGGVKFATKRFSISRGGKETLNARLELADAGIQPGPKLNQDNRTGDTRNKPDEPNSIATDLSFFEKQYGLIMKSFQQPSPKDLTSRGTLEFGRDLPEAQTKELKEAFQNEKVRALFFDKDNVVLFTGAAFVEGGEISGKKGEAFRFYIFTRNAPDNLWAGIRKIAIRPTYKVDPPKD